MLNIFNPPFMGGRTPPVLPMYDYVVRTMNREMSRVKDYYRENNFSLENTHRIIKLLIDLQSYMDCSPETLVRAVRIDLPRLCRAYGITSALGNGGIQTRGEMFKQNCADVFISVEYDFDVKKCYTYFQQLQPIKVLSHDFTDIGFGLANGKYNSQEYGTCVFSIDITMLALQFKAWWDKERYIKEQDINLPTHIFAQRYPIVNILGTHTDIAIFNRLISLLKGKEIPNSRNQHSFMVADVSPQLDKTHLQLIDKLKATKTDYLQRLNAIPSLQFGSYFRSTNHPDLAVTRNNRWAMTLARLNTVEFLLEVDRVSNSEATNMYERELMARELRIMFNDRSLTPYLPTVTVDRITRVYSEVSRE